MGYPMLTVDLQESADSVSLSFSQQKFCANGAERRDVKWLVPVTVITQSNSEPQTFLLEEEKGEVVLQGAKPGDWVKVNPNQIGAFRATRSQIKCFENSTC